MRRIFILSPANTGGERANLIFNPTARFDLARRLRHESVPLWEVFSFLSGLYFRGKYTYANRFAHPPRCLPGTYVITSNRGLLPAEVEVDLEQVRDFAQVPIDPSEPRYTEPMERDSQLLAEAVGSDCQAVLLGSIGTKKYAEILLPHFGPRLFFPSAFVGRGDMSRGGLLLRSVAEGRELEYVAVQNAVRTGKRPKRLSPRRWGFAVMEGRTVVKSGARGGA
jgi:hypothetical protein